MTRSWKWIGAIGVAALMSTACASSPTASTRHTPTPAASTTTLPAPASPRPAGSFEVGTMQQVYVDHSRVTAAHGGRPEKSSRTLDTTILYPAIGSPGGRPRADARARRGPWPVIVFGHGSTRSPVDYLGKLTYWASAGYVVIAPAFPLSKTGTPGGTAYGDYPGQTGDETFLIDQITTDDTAPLHLSSLINANHIGLGGQSFGAITALGTVASACCADKRIRAATIFAGIWLPYPSKDELAPRASNVPVLFVHGSADPTLPYAGDHRFFERLGAPGGFLTLVGSGHDPGFFGGTDTPLDTLVSKASLAFYDQHLKNGPNATPIIENLVAKAGPEVATFEPSPTH